MATVLLHDHTLDRLQVLPLVTLRSCDIHDPRGDYAERFWLPTVGPTPMWVGRRLALWLAEHPAGYRFDLTDLADLVGCPGHGSSSITRKALDRLTYYDLCRGSQRHPDTLLFRPRWPDVAAHRAEAAVAASARLTPVAP